MEKIREMKSSLIMSAAMPLYGDVGLNSQLAIHKEPAGWLMHYTVCSIWTGTNKGRFSLQTFTPLSARSQQTSTLEFIKKGDLFELQKLYLTWLKS